MEASRLEFVFRGESWSERYWRAAQCCVGAGGSVSGRFFKFDDRESAESFVEAAAGRGIRVHTLEEHIEFLEGYVKSSAAKAVERALANPVERHARPALAIDPGSRSWVELGLSEPLPLSVLRGPSGFYVRVPRGVVRVSKEEAYLIAFRSFPPKAVRLVVESSGELMGLRLQEVGILPSVIFEALVRLQPAPLPKGSGFAYFSCQDMGIVMRWLALAKLEPSIATSIVRLRHKTGYKDMPVVSPRVAKRFVDLLSPILKSVGHSVSPEEDCLLLRRGDDRVRLYFTSAKKFAAGETSEGEKAVFVPVRGLYSFDGLLYALKQLRSYGFATIPGSMWRVAVRKLCRSFPGSVGPGDCRGLAEVSSLALRDPEIAQAIRSKAALRSACVELVERALVNQSGTILDKLPQGDLRELWRLIRAH